MMPAGETSETNDAASSQYVGRNRGSVGIVRIRWLRLCEVSHDAAE